MTGPVKVQWSSERHLRIEVGEDAACDRIAGIAAAIREAGIAGLVGVLDVVPAYRTVLVHLDPDLAEAAAPSIRAIAEKAPLAAAASARRVEIPVCYDASLAPDLAEVAALHGLSIEAAIAAHAAAEYRVRFLGFAPGFAYLDGLPSALHAPRLAAPRPRVPAGSVAIASDQAGIYPRETPGGWRLIGRTPLAMFDGSRDAASLLLAGDRVRFVRISRDEFDRAAGSAG